MESASDPCVYISRDMMILVYVDDCILISKDQVPMQKFIQSLQNGTEDFVFTDEGTLANYLGVCIDKQDDGKGFSMTQPFLIERITKAIGFDLATTKGAKENVPVCYRLLNKDPEGPPKKANWNTISGTFSSCQVKTDCFDNLLYK